MRERLKNAAIRRLRGGWRRVVAASRSASHPGHFFEDPGPFPTQPRVRTNVGIHMDRLVELAQQRRARRRGQDPDYELLRENFDYMAFLLRGVHLMELPNVDPVNAFLRKGAAATGTPDVNFSMQAYLERYPELEHGPERSPYLNWLKRGRAAGQIADPAPGTALMAPVLGLSEAELVDEIAAIRSDVFDRLINGRLGEMMAKAAEIDPLVAGAWRRASEIRMFPFITREVSAMVSTLYDCHRQAGFRRARVVIVVTGPRWGSNRRAEGHIAHALATAIPADDIVVIYADQTGRTPHGKFPAGVRMIDLAALRQEREINRVDSARVLAELLRALDADAIVNINSALFYETVASYGRALAATERIFHFLFCNDQGPRGHWGGFPVRRFYRTVDTAAGIITDSWYLRDWLAETYQLSAEYVDQISVFSAPADPSIAMVTAPAAHGTPAPADADGTAPATPRRPRVCWAGRLDPQKMPWLLWEIARRMPDVEFDVWGEAVAGPARHHGPPANVVLKGSYLNFAELELGDVDVWLYTSAWDGVPSQLLEVGMTGVPMVGSLVGGTGEVLGEEAWSIPDIENPDAYVAALREVLADPAAARSRAAALRERLLAERTEEAYAAKVVPLLLKGERG